MTDFYIQSKSDLSDYTCDQTVIVKKKYLKHLSRVKYEEDDPEPPLQIIDWYPFTNSYYPFTEDVDAFSRVNHLLGSKPSFESLTTIPNCDSIYDEDSYSEKGAQLQYLTSNPISFLILGKPGIGEQELARLLADYWKCIYIDPETLIREEIEAGTRAGECIEFNLRSGRAIGVDVIIRLVEKRVKTESAKHRGFVICGFPLISNDLYEEDPVSSETAVFNVKEIFEDIFETTIEIGVPPQVIFDVKPKKAEEVPGAEEEEGEGLGGEDELEAPPPSEKTIKLPNQDVPLDIGSATTENICTAGDFEKNFEEQINFIFSLFSKPFVVIYIACSNTDTVSKHQSNRFDCLSKQVVDLQREHSDKVVYTYFSRVPGADDELPEDFMDVVKNNTMTFDISDPRQLVSLPKDFPSNVICTLNHYHYSALPVIERHILLHDVQYFIKVDGRISPVRMFSAVKTKLRVLPLQKVVLPEKLLVPPEPGGEGGPAEQMDVDGMSPEECFELFRKKSIASPMFKWGWSDWGTKCPVSMKEGSYEKGDPKFAVHFMNKIFFLSDEDAYIKFYRNPRPFLLPPYPKCSCRIFVMGPKCSGKTAVSNCLGYLLRGEVLHYDNLISEFIKMKWAEFEDKIRSAALPEGIALLDKMRREEWEKKEQERKDKIELWLQSQKQLLERFIAFKDYFIEEDEDDVNVLGVSSFPVSLSVKSKDVHLIGSDTSLKSTESKINLVKETVEELKKLISLDGLPGFREIALCEELLADPEKLLSYLPPDLLPPDTYDVEPASILDDFVKKYAEDAVYSSPFTGVELTPVVISEVIINNITEIEDRSVEQGNNRGGWIVDGVPPNKELFENFNEFCPDDVYVLRDMEDHEFLLQRFEAKGLDEFRDFRQFFMDLGKPEAAWRSPSLQSTQSYKTRVAQITVGDIFDESCLLAEKKAAEADSKQEEKDYFKLHPRIATYKKDLNKFDEDWDNVQESLLGASVTEIIVTNKSLTQLLTEVVKDMENRFRQVASVFTAEDRVEELEDFGEPDLQGEDLGEAEEKDEMEDTFFQNRRFGNTFNYCPVTFHNHWVLWRGKEEYMAKFENKLYLMCSEAAMNNFIKDPRHFLSLNSPPQSFPPLRICIVGPTASGKTTVTRSLCKNLGLYNINYGQLLKKALAPKSSFELPEILKMGLADVQGDMIESYFASDVPLPEEFLNPLVLPLWFEESVKSFGFIFDGFPKRPSDVEYMIKHSTIPDVIVELTINEAELHRRLTEKFIEKWQDDMNRKEEICERKHKEKIAAWEDRRNTRYTELMELRKEQRYSAKLKEKEEKDVQDQPSRPYLEDLTEAEDEVDLLSTRHKSEVSYDSVAEEADIEAVNAILIAEFPEPSFEEPFEESLEEAVERFTKELEDSYTIECDFLRLAKDHCEAESIPWITVDAGMSEEKVFAQVMRVVDKHKFRNQSLFERVYDISVELADKLLSNGYYFLSKFGKTCPVQIYENMNPVQMFLPLENKFQLFPVIHRQYVYFLAKKENRDKFKEDSLKYTSQKNFDLPLIPLKLAIIGPPKSGKTELSERFKRDLGMKVISRGQAGRYVLRFLEFSELARNMETVLLHGWELTSEMIAKCVEALSFDGRSITQGFVLDGFPSSRDEVCHLAQLGLVPHLVIDLQADHADIYEFLSSDKGKRGLPVFSKMFIDHRIGEFLKTKDEFREWLDREYQILAKVAVKPSKWGVWTDAYELATAVFSEIKHYYKFSHCDVALRLSNMQITPLEFIERQSIYKHYCPCCLHFDNVLISGGDPPDRTGLVQFRKFYYYICHEHIDKFIDDPEQYIPPYNNHRFPADLPARINLSDFPENAYEDGICIVCYWENLPKQVLKKGDIKYAVSFKEKVYLFDSVDCMDTFMKEPLKYYSKFIHYKGGSYPSLNYKELPIPGLLQQYDSKQLLKAIVNTATLRPVAPRLSPSVSAAINIGLYLKTNNPRTPEKFRPLYDAAKNLFHERRTNLITYLAQMKKIINPYLYYDEPMPKFIDPLIRPSSLPLSEPEPDQVTLSSAVLSDSQGSTSAMLIEDIFNRYNLDYRWGE